MSMLKRLINVITLLLVSWYVFILFSLTFLIIMNETDEAMWLVDHIDGTPEIFVITFFGWLIILFVNYILFKKVTLWNKQGDK